MLQNIESPKLGFPNARKTKSKLVIASFILSFFRSWKQSSVFLGGTSAFLEREENETRAIELVKLKVSVHVFHLYCVLCMLWLWDSLRRFLLSSSCIFLSSSDSCRCNLVSRTKVRRENLGTGLMSRAFRSALVSSECAKYFRSQASAENWND